MATMEGNASDHINDVAVCSSSFPTWPNVSTWPNVHVRWKCIAELAATAHEAVSLASFSRVRQALGKRKTSGRLSQNAVRLSNQVKRSCKIYSRPIQGDYFDTNIWLKFSLPSFPCQVLFARVCECVWISLGQWQCTFWMELKEQCVDEMTNTYIALYTCAATRAVLFWTNTKHVCQSVLSPKMFPIVVSRRRVPRLVISDNSKSFKAACGHLKSLFQSPEEPQG
jgi:hypothetical protein